MPRKKKEVAAPFVKTSKNEAVKSTDDLAKQTVELKTEFESQRKENKDIYEKAVTAYEMRAPARHFEWQSNAYLGIVNRDVRTIFPRIKKHVIGPIPQLKYVNTPSDNLEKYVSSAMRKCDGYLEMSDTFFDACLVGTGWGKSSWDYECQKIKVTRPKSPKQEDVLARIEAQKTGKEFKEEYEEVDKLVEFVNGIVYWHVPWLNIFCNNLETDDVDEATIIEVMNTNIHALKARSRDKNLNPYGHEFGQYDNVDRLVAIENIRQYLDPQSSLRSVRAESIPNQGLLKNPITLFIRQGDFEHNNKFYRNGIATVAMCNTKDGKQHYVTLRVRDCPRSDGHKIYHRVCYERVPGRMYGRGIYDTNARNQDTTNDFLRSCIDKNTIYLHRPIAFDVGRVPDPSLIQVRMGGMMPVGGPPNEILRELQFEPTHADAWRVIEMLVTWAQEQSGAKDPIAGESPKGQRTASGVSMITRGALERVMDTCRDMAEEFISGKNGIGKAFYCYVKDHFKEHKEAIGFAFTNNRGETEKDLKLSEEDLGDEADVYCPSLFERIDRDDMSNTMMQILQYGGQLMGEENLLEFLRIIAEYKEVPNWHRLFMPNPQSVPMEVIVMTLQKLGIDTGQFFAALNQISKEQAQNQGSSGGGNARSPANVQPSKNQGSANTPMKSIGANTGR